MDTYDLSKDLSEPRLAVGDPADAKTVKWLALAVEPSGTRPGLAGLHRDNGVTASTDGFRLHVAPTPKLLENETTEVIRPLDGKWPTPAAKAQSYVATVQDVQDTHFPAYRQIVDRALAQPVAAKIRLDGKFLADFCAGLVQGEAVEIIICANKREPDRYYSGEPAILATVPGSNSGKCPARFALIMPIWTNPDNGYESPAYNPFIKPAEAPAPVEQEQEAA